MTSKPSFAMKRHFAGLLFAALFLLSCNAPRAFRNAYQDLEKQDFAAAKTGFEPFRYDARYGPAARYFLTKIKLGTNPDFGELCLLDRALPEIGADFERLPPKVKKRQTTRFSLDSTDFSETREQIQRRMIAHVRVRGTIAALDSLMEALPDPVSALQGARDETRADIVNAQLDATDYDVLTAIVQRYLAFVKPENYGKSRRLNDRLWTAFTDKYPLCQLDKYAADHRQSFVARDCWRKEIRELLCQNNLSELLDFHAANRWTAFESVLLNAIADKTADFTRDSALRPDQKAQLLDLRRRNLVLARIRNAGSVADTAALLRQTQEYIARYAPRYSAFRSMEEMLQYLLEKKQYDRAISLLKDARPFFPDTLPKGCATNFDYQWRVKPWIDGKLPILEKTAENLQKIPLEAVNTSEGDEFSPVLSPDGATLYFGAAGRRDNIAGQDVFVSRFRAGRWSAPEPVVALSGEGSQYPLSIGANGRQMLLLVDGRLHLSQSGSNGWSAPTPLPLSGLALAGKGVFSPDGNMIALEGAFSAGGVLTPPDMDIYILQREAGGQWSAPVALGSDINTEGQEGNPLFGPDGRTLYFTSTGFPGMGKADVFVTYRKQDKNLANDWLRAVNMGKEINDTYQHRGFGALSPDGKTAYYALYQRDGENGDIWMVTLPKVEAQK